MRFGLDKVTLGEVCLTAFRLSPISNVPPTVRTHPRLSPISNVPPTVRTHPRLSPISNVPPTVRTHPRLSPISKVPPTVRTHPRLSPITKDPPTVRINNCIQLQGQITYFYFNSKGCVSLKFRIKQATLLAVFGPEEGRITLLRIVSIYVMIYTL